MEPEFCTPIQISSCGGRKPKASGWVFMTPQSLTGRSPNRAPQEHPLDGSNEIVPVLVLEEKDEYDDEDEESFLSGMKSSLKIIRNSS